VATAGTLTGFASSGRLASYAGLVPVPQGLRPSPGQPTQAQALQPQVGASVYLAALSSIRVNGPSRTFYQRKRSERRIHIQGAACPRASSGGCAVGAASRRPHLQSQRTATSRRLTRSFRFRHGTTNLFAALNVGTGQVYGECKPSRNGAEFLAFLRRAVKPHTGTDIHVVLDNLSTHTTPEVMAWLRDNPHVHFHFTPVGSSWINQIVRHEVA
jgi:hypothetical protein